MVIGFLSAFAWLVGMTAIIALLSDYIVDTIEVWWVDLFVQLMHYYIHC